MTQTVLITGGSSGIGLEISKRFARAGYVICWVSLLEDEIKEAVAELQKDFPQTIVHYLVQDLSREDSAQLTINWAHQQQFDIDVLINNAGYATYGMSTDIPYHKEVNMIQLNVMTVYKLTRLFLDDMISRGSGKIINISSSTSFQPVPRMAAYAATKAWVAHYSQALNEELKEQGSKVRVMTVCPAGIKDTKFKVAAKMEKVKTFESILATTKEEVADDIWKAYESGKSYVATGAKLRRTNWLTKLLPKPIVLRLMKDELSETE